MRESIHLKLTYLNLPAHGHKFLAGTGDALVDRIHYGHGILLAPSLLLENRLHFNLMKAHNFVSARTKYNKSRGSGSLVNSPNEWTR